MIEQPEMIKKLDKLDKEIERLMQLREQYEFGSSKSMITARVIANLERARNQAVLEFAKLLSDEIIEYTLK